MRDARNRFPRSQNRLDLDAKRRESLPLSRRTFLAQIAASSAARCFLLGDKKLDAAPGFDAIIPRAKIAADPLRPQFHLLPARNWMNDPNGCLLYTSPSPRDGL